MTTMIQNIDEIVDLDEALDELTIFWIDEGLTYKQATRLGLYQLTGGNLFGGSDDFAERPTC